MVLVDSSIWIEAFRREGSVHVKLAVKGLLDEYEVALCSTVQLEVMGAVRKEERAKLGRNFDILPYVAVVEEDWATAVKLSWRLRDAGQVVKWSDILIATVALRKEVRVYTQDGHFQIMHQLLGLQLYTPGYNGIYNPG
jgi:predicted nucleic acid-binding protein